MDTADTPLAFWSFSLAATGYVALAAYLLAAGGDWRHNARTRRIGYAANRQLAPVFTRWITNTESCASQPSQWAALAALTGPQDEAIAMRERFRARRDLIVGLLNQVPGIACKTPGGANTPAAGKKFGLT